MGIYAAKLPISAPHFDKALNHLAIGQMTEDEVNLFKARQVEPVSGRTITHLFYRNEDVDNYNEAALKKIPGITIVCTATDTCQ